MVRVGLVRRVGKGRDRPVPQPGHHHPADQDARHGLAPIATVLLADQNIFVVVERVERHVRMAQVVDEALCSRAVTVRVDLGHGAWRQGERGRVDVEYSGIIAVVGDDGVLPRRRDRDPVDAAPAREPAVCQVARRANHVRLHVHHEHPSSVRERREPPVEGRIPLPGAEVVHAERQRPTPRLRARHHVEPHQLTAVHVNPFVWVRRARVPPVVARTVVRALASDGLIRVPIEENHARRAVVLQRQ